MYVGDPLQFNLTLWDFAEDMFVQAVVYADNVRMPYSPITIPHKEDGHYYLKDEANYFFPDNTLEVTIVYRVFHDAAFTERSYTHAPANYTYLLTKPISDEIEDKIDKIIDIVTSHPLTSQIIGYVEAESDLLTGYVIPDDIVGYVEEDSDLIGFLTDTELEGKLDNDDDVEGFFSL